jgi:hypothetical protein
MELVNYIREIWPQAYWSAGFIACLVVVIIVSGVLYAITRWPAWIMTTLAAVLYMIPFFIYMR